MVTDREGALALCLQFPFTYEDTPFDDPNWTAVRHKENRKIFALLFQREGRIWINLKAEPMWGDLWRQAYPSVVPAYHMNKRHWISVILDGSLSDSDLYRLIGDSYALTASKKHAKQTPLSQSKMGAGRSNIRPAPPAIP